MPFLIKSRTTLGLGFDRRPAEVLARPEGGSTARVKSASDMARKFTAESGVPWILAALYSPTPVINPEQVRSEGIGMVNRVYVPVGSPEGREAVPPRNVFDKLGNWFQKGTFK